MENTDAAQRLTQQLRADLARGEYHPRERLVEIDLMHRYGFARGAVRTALVQLQAEGLIERLPNKGATVRGLTIDEAIELAEVRRELEQLCAARAALRAGADGHRRLAGTLDTLRFLVEADDLHAYRQASIDFHQLVVSLAEHSVASRQLEAIRNHNLQQQFPTAFQVGVVTDSSHDHLAIGDAILRGDADAASREMRRHLDRVVALLADYRAQLVP